MAHIFKKDRLFVSEAANVTKGLKLPIYNNKIYRIGYNLIKKLDIYFWC